MKPITGFFALLALVVFFCKTPTTLAVDKWDDVVTKVEAKFEPAEAKPGQTVTLKLTFEFIEGWWTYPTRQVDPAARSQVTRIVFPDPGNLIFVGPFEDPKGFLTKADPETGIKELRYYTRTVTWERKAIVSPKASKGKTSVAIKEFRMIVCDKETCLPPKKVLLNPELIIREGNVEVEPQFKDEVNRALQKKE
jgi:hypothetical protein